MSNDNELSNLDLNYLYSISNINGNLMPDNCNIITTYKKDTHKNQSSLEDKDINIFKIYGHAVLFHRWDSNSAHWIPIIRNKNNDVIVFDSLGRNGILKDKKLINTIINKMKENGMNSITFNEKPYQCDGTKTCGKWTIYAISMNKLLKGADIKEIKKHLDDKKKKYKSYDNYILNLFSKENV